MISQLRRKQGESEIEAKDTEFTTVDLKKKIDL